MSVLRRDSTKIFKRPASVSGGAVLALVASLALSGTSLAQQSQLSGEAAQKLKQDRQRLEQVERRTKDVTANVAAMEQERVRLNTQLQETARSVQASEARLSSIETRRDQLEADKQKHQANLSQRYATIASLLSTMQRMGHNPPPVIITRREDALEMVRSAMLLARAVPELQTQVGQLVASIAEVDNVIRQITEERTRLQTETEHFRSMEARLASLMEEKRQTLTERQSELVALRRDAEAIATKVNELGELITALDHTVAQRTGLGTYNQQTPPETPVTGNRQATDLNGSPLSADPITPPAAQRPADKGTQVAVLMTPGAGAIAGSAGRLKPAVPFHQARGQLPFPAAGQRVLSFGDTTSNGRKSQGVVIETRQGAHITSPCDGWIVYAGEFRSYGQLLIINAGAGYHVLLAGLSHIDAQLGQFVLAGEPVGNMSSAPGGATQDNAPVLYVEFRKEGRPIDPTPWWHEAHQQKVQG